MNNIGERPICIQDVQDAKVNPPPKLCVSEYIQDTSNWWNINERWFLVRNDQNPTYSGSGWGKFFYDLVYVPHKGIFEAGNHAEVKAAENTKKKIYTIVTLGGIGTILLTLGISTYYIIPPPDLSNAAPVLPDLVKKLLICH